MNQMGRRERKRQQTMDHLADTAWALFEAEGFANVTMEAIADSADVAKGTLYKYFPVKEALLRHYLHGRVADTVPSLLEELSTLPTVTQQLQKFLERNAEWAEEHRDYLAPYLRFRMSEVGVPYDLNASGRSGLEGVFTQLISTAQKSGEFRTTPDATTSAHYLEFLYLAAMLRWLSDADEDLNTAFATMLDLFVKGMAR